MQLKKVNWSRTLETTASPDTPLPSVRTNDSFLQVPIDVWHCMTFTCPWISILEMNERKFNDSWRLQVTEDREGVMKHSQDTAAGSHCEAWAWRSNGKGWCMESGSPWGSGRRLILAICWWGDGGAACVKPQQGRAMEGFTHLFSLPSSPAVPPLTEPNPNEARGQGARGRLEKGGV